MRKRKLLNSICLATAMSLTLSLFPAELRAESSTSNEIISEENGFDENAHGEIIKEGNCGALYKLYEDKTLYIYGNDEIKTIYLGNYSYFLNEDILDVYIEEGVTGIGEKAFYECKDIKQVRIPESVKKIGNHAFAYCESLKTINLPGSIENIEKNAFFACKSLGEIEIPNKVATICKATFSCCDNLISVTLPEGLKQIEASAFNNCAKLEKITLPYGLETIGEEAFSWSGLKNIVIPDSVTLIDSKAFSIPFHSVKVLIPDSVLKIRDGSFANAIIYCNENSEAERYAKENNITYKPISKWDEPEIVNTFNGCKGSPVKVSIACKESDEFTFECKDKCEMKSEYTGYSSIQAGGFSSYSKDYELIFNNVGEHIISAYKNGNLMKSDKIIITENHTWDSGKIENNPTCEKDGSKKYTCSNCKNSYSEKIPPTGHNYSEKITRKESCKLNGIKTYICSNCRDSYKRLIPHINHKYSGKITKQPGCTSTGLKTYTCSNCKKTYTDTIPATKHKYSSWKTSKKPTIFKNGTKTRKCSNCGKQETKTIKKLKASVSIKKKASVKAGKSIQLKIYKKSKGDKISNWTSSKKSVATVNKKGKVTARKKGKAKITVKMKSGCKATCTVTVK